MFLQKVPQLGHFFSSLIENRTQAPCLLAPNSPILDTSQSPEDTTSLCVQDVSKLEPSLPTLWDVQRPRHLGRAGRHIASPNTFPEALWRRQHQWEGRSHSGRQHQSWRAWARFRAITEKSTRSHQPRQGFTCLETQGPCEWVQPCGLPLVVPSYLPRGRRLHAS